MNDIDDTPEGVTDSHEHRAWCHQPECTIDDEAHIHRSIVSTVNGTMRPHPRFEVHAEEAFFSDGGEPFRPDRQYPHPTVYLHEHGHDGWDLTPQEARQLAQALTMHAALADGQEVSPLEQAATLVVGMLAYTGRDPNKLHAALVDWLDVMVDAMAEVRRP